jgi:hypothetical protein
MAQTYEPIATYTTTNTSTGTYTFSSIPQTYTDLRLVMSMRNSSGYPATDTNGFARFNNDTSSVYNYTTVGGTGSSTYSNRTSNFTAWMWNFDTPNGFTEHHLDIFNYTSTSVNKSFLASVNLPIDGMVKTVGVWRSTAAITSLVITASDRWRSVGATPDQWDVGTTFTLYGIKAA